MKTPVQPEPGTVANQLIKRGEGSLSIEAGGRISSLSSYIGYGHGSTGKATVTGQPFCAFSAPR